MKPLIIQNTLFIHGTQISRVQLQSINKYKLFNIIAPNLKVIESDSFMDWH